MEVHKSLNEQLFTDTKPILTYSIEFQRSEHANVYDEGHRLQKKYILIKPEVQGSSNGNGKINRLPNGLTNGKAQSPQNGTANGAQQLQQQKNDGIPPVKHTICSADRVQLEWKQSNKIGAGYQNLGNTCFMNSVLQCLTHCPPLVNYLLYSNENHLTECKVSPSFCMTCELTKHIRKAYDNSGDVIKPFNIFNRLKMIARHFQQGRQEDSHEFLRYVIDNIWKSAVMNWEFRHSGVTLDSRSKETTFINQIFGGYHRSQITCLCCKAKSNTYDYFMDFILDIKQQGNLEKALEKFVQPEILQNENAYKCTKCNKKVPAQKRFTVHRAPNVATFQLKRFDYNRIFGGKITKHVSFPETFDLRPYMSENKGQPIMYRLNAVLVHLGHTSNSGHYYCYVRNHSNNWYLMDDSKVSQVQLSHVLQQQAYILFYVRTSLVAKFSFTQQIKSAASATVTTTMLNAENRITNVFGNNNQSNVPNTIKHQQIKNSIALPATATATNGISSNHLATPSSPKEQHQVKVKSIPIATVTKVANDAENDKLLNGFDSTPKNLDSQSSTPSMAKQQQIKDDAVTPVITNISITENRHTNGLSNGQAKNSESRSNSPGSLEQQQIKTTAATTSITSITISTIELESRPVNGFDSIHSSASSISKKHKKKKKKKQKEKEKEKDKYRHHHHHHHDHSSGEGTSDHDEFVWVERTKESMERDNHHKTDQKREPTAAAAAAIDTIIELKKMPLNMYGHNVCTWDGQKTELDMLFDMQQEANKKRSKDDMFNEEYDRGKTKKVKSHASCSSYAPTYSKYNSTNKFDIHYSRKYLNQYQNSS